MSLSRAFKVMAKDLKMGPRSPIFLYAFILPVALTFVINVVFGSIFEPVPRFAVVDEGNSEISREAKRLPGIEVTFLESAQELKEMVRANDFDAGLVLQRGFDEAVREGRQPDLHFFISGESLASNRIILSVATFEMIRQVQGATAPVAVKVETTGPPSIPLTARLLPLIVMYAVIIGGLFVPAASLVEEKESKTIDAVLVTPVQMPEVLVGKGGLGIVLAMAIGIMTLIINNAFGANPGALIIVLLLASLMSAEFGLVLGSLAPDTNTLFTFIKSLGIFFAAPVIFFIWPGLPQWVAKIFPTYYFLSPIFEVAVKNFTLSQVATDVAIGYGLCAAFLPLAWLAGRRMLLKLGSD